MFYYQFLREVILYEKIFFEKKLDSANIRYEIRSDDFGRSNRGSGLLGSLGENMNQKIMYYVYVRKNDYDFAKSIINGTVPRA